MASLYYVLEDSGLLRQAIGLTDPLAENHPWEGPAQLTEEELNEPGNELIAADFFELAQTYTEDNPLSAENFYQDPLLLRLSRGWLGSQEELFRSAVESSFYSSESIPDLGWDQTCPPDSPEGGRREDLVNTNPSTVDSLKGEIDLRFPRTEVNLTEVILGDSFLGRYFGAYFEIGYSGLFLIMEEGARVTHDNRVDAGALQWDCGDKPLLKLDGFTLMLMPPLINPIDISGVIIRGNKILLTYHFYKTFSPGISEKERHFDITSFVADQLDRLDPEGNDDRRLKEVLFNDNGTLRSDPPIHELQAAVVRAFEKASGQKPSKKLSRFDLFSRQIDWEKIKGQAVINDLEIDFSRSSLGSLRDLKVEVEGAGFFGEGSSAGFQVQGEMPLKVSAQMETDENKIDLKLQGTAWLDFDSRTGKGAITFETADDFKIDNPGTRTDGDYGGRMEAHFHLPAFDSFPPDYSKLLEEAVFSLMTDMDKNGSRWLGLSANGKMVRGDEGNVTVAGNILGMWDEKFRVNTDSSFVGAWDTNFVSAAVMGETKLLHPVLEFLGNQTLLGVTQDPEGTVMITLRSEFDLYARGPDSGKTHAVLGNGQIAIKPLSDGQHYQVEIEGITVDVTRGHFWLDGGAEINTLDPGTEASLSGSWKVAGDSPADFSNARNWIGKGTLALKAAPHLEVRQYANHLRGEARQTEVLLLEIGDMQFGQNPSFSGQIEAGVTQGSVEGMGGGIPFSGIITQARGTIQGTIIPRETEFLVRREVTPEIISPPVPEMIFPAAEEEPLFVQQHASPFQQEATHQTYRKVTSLIPPEERIRNPKTRREKVTSFFQQVIDALPSLKGFDFTKADVRIAPDSDYQEGKVKIPLLGDKQNGIQVTVLEGTKVDPQQSSILAEEGKLKEFRLDLNHPITVAGLIKVSGVELKSSHCPFTGKERHDVMVKTCLGNFNVLSLLNLIGNQFDAYAFYKMLKERYGIDIPRNSVPRDLNQLGLFLYELFKLYGDRLDSLTRPESGAPDMIAIRELGGKFNLHLKPGLSIDMNDLHAETDHRARGAFSGKFEWKPEENLIDVRMAQKEGEAVEGIVVDMQGDKGMSAVFDRISAIHYRSKGEGKQREYQVSVGASHVDNLNVIYTPAGKTEPLFHLVSGNDPASGEHSFIEANSFQVARVKEEDGAFHYEVKVDQAKAHSPHGHVDFSYQGRSGRYDYSGGKINNLDINLLGKSFPGEEENNPLYSGFEKIVVNGDLEHPQNPNVTDKNPWLVLDLGEGGELVFNRLSIRRGHVHVETAVDASGQKSLPIEYSGLVDMLADIPSDSRFKGLETIAVQGPALVTLNGPEGSIVYTPFDGEDDENLDVTVTGSFKFPVEGGELHINRVALPLLELILHQQKTDRGETTIPKRLILADRPTIVDLHGIYTTPEWGRLGRRQVQIPEGSRLTLKSSQNLVVDMEAGLNILPIDLHMMLSTEEGRRLARIELIDFLVQAGLVQIKSARFEFKKVRDHLHGTEISFDGRVHDVEVDTKLSR